LRGLGHGQQIGARVRQGQAAQGVVAAQLNHHHGGRLLR